MENLSKKRLNRNQLKCIAVFAMIIDHTAAIFLSESYILYTLLRCVGRLTAPIMSFFIFQGYIHTSSKEKYISRMLLFALLSQIPYTLAFSNNGFSFSILTTFFLSLLLLFTVDSEDGIEKYVLCAAILILSCFCDTGLIAPLWILFFYKYKDNRKKQFVSFSIITMLYVTMLLICDYTANTVTINTIIPVFYLFAIPLLLLYNGEPGKKTKISKWGFYIFYPAHLLLLFAISCIVQ